jgi:uncharacterized protein YcbK (DUF882 family)
MAYLHRRAFLRASGAAAFSVTSSLAIPAFAKVASPPVITAKATGCRTLVMNCLRSGETLKADYWVDGNYVPGELARINKLLRDVRNNEVHPIDLKLIDLVHALSGTVDANSIEIICGYRSPATNEFLRKHSSGVAEKSLHLKGQAIDLRVAGRQLKQVHDAALALQLGGVGYYPGSNFIHVDTGRVRRWTG